MRTRLALLLAVLLSQAFVASPAAEVVEGGNLRVAFEGGLAPHRLPRSGSAPVRVSIGGRIFTTDGADPPQLRRISVAINRNGHLDPTALPVCRIEQIQPATTAGALEACRSSLVGTGSFSARVLLPEQAPFPSEGEVFAFNGSFHGRPALLVHIYGTEPVPTSYTLPFEIRSSSGDFGTALSVSLPAVTSEWGHVTAFSLKLGGGVASHGSHGRRRSYLSAGCPAPNGFNGAVFPLARVSFGFAGRVLS